MVSVVRIYRNRAYASVSLVGLLLWFFSFTLHSCSIGGVRSNINPIRKQDLLTGGLLERRIEGNRRISIEEDNQPLIHELRGKIEKLKNKGFIDGNDPNNNDIRKHLMFVFFHMLRFKQMHNLTAQAKIDRFMALPDSPDLIWQPFLIQRGQREMIEFKLKHLLTLNDPRRVGNEDDIEGGTSPRLKCNDRFLLVRRVDRRTLWPLEPVEIDHLLKDNNITIEIPKTIHEEKTKFIDGLINYPDTPITRDSVEYWERRYNDYMNNVFPT